jgi:hypothetical protein
MITLAVSLAALAFVGTFAGDRLGAPAGSPDASRATGAVRGALWAFAALVVVEASLGFAGQLTARNVALGLVAFALALAARPRRAPATPPRAPFSRLDLALTFAIGAAVALLLWKGLCRTEFPYDTLSYHLYVPATWMQERRLVIVPAVFGDIAPAYAPSNIELWFLFLMSPLRSEYLAAAGQIPFAVLAVAAVVAAVREAGGGRPAALGAGLAFLLVPEVWEQSSTAMVDVGMTAFLLSSLPFARRSELPTCVAALGLALGSKHIALVFGLPFFVFAGLTAIRRNVAVRPLQIAVVLAVLLATGGFWYLRNAVVTGNPLFPAAIAGLHLPAAYDSRALRSWMYHTPISNVMALAVMLVSPGVGFVTAMGVALARRPRQAEALIAIAMIALFWLVIPWQGTRFLFAVFGVVAIAIGRAAADTDAAPVLGWGALLAAIVGGLFQRTTAEWAALLAAAAVGWFGCPLGARVSRRVAFGVVASAAAAVGIFAFAGFAGYLAREPPYRAPVWSWLRDHVRDSRVAYAGDNLAFPLTGARIGNRVRYVNVAGEASDALHDFVRRAGVGPASTPEPAFLYRNGGSFEVWWRNLQAYGAEVLYVSKVRPIVLLNMTVEPDGFPVERRWAEEHPERFSLAYASPKARVYWIHQAP